jgi:ABC-type multidrug transport system fused ATPase/permease subunit
MIDGQSLPTGRDTTERDSGDTSDVVSLQSYYHHIGYLTQEPSIFDGTIYENLTYALDYTPSDDQIHNAIEQSQCQFISQFTE